MRENIEIEDREQLAKDMALFLSATVIPDGLIYKQGHIIVDGSGFKISHLNTLMNKQIPNHLWKLRYNILVLVRQALESNEAKVVPVIEKIYTPAPVIDREPVLKDEKKKSTGGRKKKIAESTNTLL